MPGKSSATSLPRLAGLASLIVANLVSWSLPVVAVSCLTTTRAAAPRW